METSLHCIELPPLSLYIHTPWCIKKCPYCDFNSHTTQSESLPTKEYFDALIRDFEQDSQWLQGRAIQTIFIGGGTPSMLSADFYHQLFTKLKEMADLSQCNEITLEANPGTFEQEKFIRFREVGINRLSIGIQSFNEGHLQTLGRVHSAHEAKAAIEIAHKANFNSFNLDLMHGLPGQTLEESLHDLEIAIAYQPAHLSWYQLTVEPNTVFYKQRPILPAEDTLWQIQERGKRLLQHEGFTQYEVSAYSQQSRLDNRCSHNINYWQFGDYIGIGAGAHGKITVNENTSSPHQSITRTQKTRLPKDYINAFSSTGMAGCKVIKIDAKERPIEFLMNALRLNCGFTSAFFTARTGLPFSLIENEIESLIQDNLLYKDGTNIAASKLGLHFLDSILEKFL